jgi:cold shock CspA family protein
MSETEPDYYRGTVQRYRDQEGCGYIEPDPEQAITGLLVFHRSSLRSRATSLRSNDRVIFTVRDLGQGALAFDVHPELVEGGDSDARVKGRIHRYWAERGYGFLTTKEGHQAFFHVNSFLDENLTPAIGLDVTCRLLQSDKGWQAQDLAVIDSNHEAAIAGLNPDTSKTDWLAQAILARDARRYDEAARLYEKGLLQEPSVQLILSWAAMEKNRNRKPGAMRVYEEGIKRFQGNAKLREDAGILAASLGDFRAAVRLLEESLSLCRSTEQGGEKGVLLGLARTHYQADTLPSLHQSIGYYEEAVQLFGRGRTQLPEADLLRLNIARIRTKHNRGNLCAEFLKAAHFEIIRASLLEQATEGAEFVIGVDNPELRETYGIASHLIVRCMFKSQVALSDLTQIDDSVKRWASSGLGDEQVALLVVSSLPQELQKLLSARIEDKRALLPALVPLPQSDIETGAEALGVLRAALDRWLYRRDLFAVSSPVEGNRFFGRDRPLAQLRDAIASATPTGVFGLRKVGKTSLLKEAQRRAVEQGDVVVYIDLLRVPSDISDCGWLYWKLADGLKRSILHLPLPPLRWRVGGVFTDFLDIPNGFPLATAFDSDLSKLLNVIRTAPVHPKPRLVVLLDEIERLLPTLLGKPGFGGFFDFFSYLRGVSQEHGEFVLIITGANASVSEIAQFDRRDNPVFNYFKEVYLPPLEPTECTLMMRELGRGMGIRFSADAHQRVYHLTGGHPFFARQLCSFVAERNKERPLQVSREMIEQLVDEYLDVRSGDFQEIVERLDRDFPDELTICIFLAEAGGRLPVESVRSLLGDRLSAAIKHLTGYQIVAMKRDELFISIDLLNRWLQRRYVRKG